MRVLIVLFVLLFTGCASVGVGALSGSQSKNGGPMRFERLGSITGEDVPNLRKCGAYQVSWCSGAAAGDNCVCITTYEAENRARREVRGHGGPGA